MELSLCIFTFHPNHSSGKERGSLPAEFPVPHRSPGTMKALICILQFPGAEQSSAVPNMSLLLPSLPAALPVTCCCSQPYAERAPVVPVSRAQLLKRN